MPKKTTLLIIILAIVTGVLLFLAVSSYQKQNNLSTTLAPTKAPVQKTAKVYFNPETSSVASGTQGGVDIMVDTGSSDITGVQAEIQYDPKAITNVKLLPAADTNGFFGGKAIILFNEVKPSTGRISYAITINAGEPTRKGIGKIATLLFEAAPGAPATTTVNFLERTLVAKLGVEESVLKETVPLTINLTKGTAQPTLTLPSRTVPPQISQ